MKLIRILALATYKGMEKLVKQIAHEMKCFDLQIVTPGDFAAGIKQLYSEQDFDFIISRNESLHFLARETTIPIVEIPLSEYDILHAFQIAKGFSEKFCVVGSPGLIARIKTLCNLMEFDINVSAINEADETPAEISALKKEGYTLIMGDANVVDAAKEAQLRGILIISGKESILSALNECKKLHDILEQSKNESRSLKQMVNHCPVYIFSYNRQRELLYSNMARPANRDEMASISKILPPLVERVFEKREIKLFRKNGSFLWNLHGVEAEPDMACFYVRRIMRSGSQDASLSIQDDFSGNTAIMQSYYLESASMNLMTEKAKRISRDDYPVLLTGEPGTGKNTLAFAIHRQSKLQNSTFLIINCQLITEKELYNLLEEDDSPLSEENMGIQFRDIHYLSPKAQELLIAYIKETDLHKRNRVIYTYTFSFAGKEEHNLLKYLKNERECDCLTLLIPPLRDHKEDIPALATLYINELNSNYGKQIVGLANASLEILREYDWPENLGQFIRVIKDLVLNTEGAYIEAEEVKAVIAKERQLTGENRNFVSLKGSLNKITAGIIWQVFTEEDMNQVRAAKRLGISRSTMWRKLKEYHAGNLE